MDASAAQGVGGRGPLIGPFRLQPFYPFLLSTAIPGPRTAFFFLPCHLRNFLASFDHREHTFRVASLSETSGRWNVALEFFHRVSSRLLPSPWLRFSPFSRRGREKMRFFVGWNVPGSLLSADTSITRLSTKTREFNFTWLDRPLKTVPPPWQTSTDLSPVSLFLSSFCQISKGPRILNDVESNFESVWSVVYWFKICGLLLNLRPRWNYVCIVSWNYFEN